MIDDYPGVFKGELGQLPGEAHFITDPSVTHVVSPVRRIPVSHTEKVRHELDHLSFGNMLLLLDNNLLIGLAIWLLL